MILSELKLHQFRSYTERDFQFDPKLTIISGPNGSGKTNILEAIYTLGYGHSFRDPDPELTQLDTDWWRIEGVFDETRRELRFVSAERTPKQLSIEGVKKGRPTYRNILPMVLFEPDDMLIIHGSPSRRREYFDRLLMKLNPTYRQALSRYQRALIQRNNLLKRHHTNEDDLFVWDVMLSENGAIVMQHRQELLKSLQGTLQESFSRLSSGQRTLEIRYSRTDKHSSAQYLASELHSQLKKDMMLGYTTHGPHRDDYEFLMSGNPAEHTASRGEVRSMVLGLKCAERQLLSGQTALQPIILLDDVFSELDREHRTQLMKLFGDDQVIITTTDADITKHSVRQIKL